MPSIRVKAIESYDTIRGNYNELLNSIDERADEIASIIDEIEDEEELLNREKTIDKEAFLQAVEFISDNTQKYINAGVLDAMYQTFEFNYQPYIDHMLGAIALNYENMVKIKPLTLIDYRDIDIDVDFTPLGNIEIYAEAVEATRKELPEKVTEDPKAASRMWREKIFKTAREGGKVYRHKKDRKTGKETKVDVTYKYIGRYYDTIVSRLSKLPQNKAPFWYLIEYGNINIEGFNKKGTPYPSLRELKMIGKIEATIRADFNTAYRKFSVEIENIISDKLWGEFGFKGSSPGLKSIDKEATNEIRKVFTEKKELEMTAGKILNIIKRVDADLEIYRTTANNLAVRARGARGRFVTLAGR